MHGSTECLECTCFNELELLSWSCMSESNTGRCDGFRRHASRLCGCAPPPVCTESWGEGAGGVCQKVVDESNKPEV